VVAAADIVTTVGEISGAARTPIAADGEVDRRYRE
jgi:hypothetical protein